MADYTLGPTSTLGGYNRELDGASLTEVTSLAIVSVAVPQAGGDRLSKAVKSAYGCALPKASLSVLSKDSAVRLVSTRADRFLVLFDCETPDAANQVTQRLGDAGYVTDRSDGWVALTLSGAAARSALERVCPLDLHPDAFAVNGSARTVMDQLDLVIIRTGDDRYLLLSPRTSALSFVGSLETAIENVT